MNELAAHLPQGSSYFGLSGSGLTLRKVFVMADKSVRDFFLDAASDQAEDLRPAGVDAVVVPVVGTSAAPALAEIVPTVEVSADPALTAAQTTAVPIAPPPVAPPQPSAPVRTTSDREARIAAALDGLMRDNHDVQAAALVSLDGFTMASALPETMQEDRVGAMSAAILGLGERAAAELGKGQLTQVFIEGAEGYVLLVAAGGRAVLTVLAHKEAKLGLVLYDMKAAADTIAEILR